MDYIDIIEFIIKLIEDVILKDMHKKTKKEFKYKKINLINELEFRHKNKLRDIKDDIKDKLEQKEDYIKANVPTDKLDKQINKLDAEKELHEKAISDLERIKN